jgi:hypothetical protein
MVHHSRQDRRVVYPNADARTVRLERKASRPPETVDLLYSGGCLRQSWQNEGCSCKAVSLGCDAVIHIGFPAAMEK